ncbi:MAG: HAD hydrolase family protein [Solobacterium sp.]|nr:HAD hydrolase family protein [Solobacterium sp.]
MFRKRYFFFDIDGTLTDLRTGVFVPSGLQTIRELEAQGHFVAIATGRACYKTIPAARTAGIHNYVANGGAALILNDEIIRNSPLDRDKALMIIHEADALGYGILIAPGDSTDVLMRDSRFLDQAGERQEPTNYILQPDLSFDTVPAIYKFYLSVPEGEENRIASRDLLGHIRMDKPYFWYQHDDKDRGIRDMLAYLGADPADAVVFGDGENDMVMFGQEWLSIAMGGGYPALLAMADYVTDPAPLDGIRKACRHFGWIPAE